MKMPIEISSVSALTDLRSRVPRLAALGVAAALAVGLFVHAAPPEAAEAAHVIPAPAADETPAGAATETAVLAGGCFWGVQGVFQHVKGVSNAVSGYAGGSATTAHYEMVGSGMTGHAETVSVTFDPKQISYGKILQIYFSVAHDPTQLNRQGPDSGTQYRSTIFPSSPEQKRVAAAYVAQLDAAKVFNGKIVTTLEPLAGFYPAETYHQDFLLQHPNHPYIVNNDLPKVENLKKLFPDEYKSDAARVLTASR